MGRVTDGPSARWTICGQRGTRRSSPCVSSRWATTSWSGTNGRCFGESACALAHTDRSVSPCRHCSTLRANTIAPSRKRLYSSRRWCRSRSSRRSVSGSRTSCEVSLRVCLFICHGTCVVSHGPSVVCFPCVVRLDHRPGLTTQTPTTRSRSCVISSLAPSRPRHRLYPSRCRLCRKPRSSYPTWISPARPSRLPRRLPSLPHLPRRS